MTIPTDPAARRRWNDDIEKRLQTVYNRGTVPSMFHVMPSFLNVAFLSIQSGSVTKELAIRLTEVCALQRDLSAGAIQYLGGYDLEINWKNTPTDKKQGIAREAIYRTCSVDGFEQFRLYCPEMTTKELPRRFISLLQIFTTAQNAKTKEDPPYDSPIHIDNDKFDEYMKPPRAHREQLQTFVQLHRLYRTYCISLTLWYMLLAFHGMEEEVVPIKNRHKSRTDDERTASHDLRKLVPKNVSQGIKRAHEEVLATAKKPGCSNCRKRPEELNGSKKMMVCGQCNKNGLRSFYCSKECQVQDWRNGHKEKCGGKKILGKVTDIAPPSSPSFDPYSKGGIPKAIPPFTHSPALLHQIAFLTREKGKYDYFLMYPHPHPDRGIALQEVSAGVILVKLTFHVMRRRAMSTGDPSAVTFMYRVLRKGMIDNPSDDTILREQLFKEYGVDVDDEEIGLLEGAPKMEEDEMKAVVDFLDTCAST